MPDPSIETGVTTARARLASAARTTVQRARFSRAALAAFATLPPAADVVFCAGPNLQRVKADCHPHVHCVPSSVDVEHFAPGRRGLVDPADQASLRRPRLGFFGTIDERVDPALLGALARAHPAWEVVLVGPTARIDPASLPQLPNVHYLGGRPYDALPAYVGGWDVCLVPFARNDATEFLSPTKTLEYMAAERPIVSTCISDVAEPYRDIVYPGDGPADFVAASEGALGANRGERAVRTRRTREVLARTSWDATVETMARLVGQAIQRRRAGRAA